MFDIRNQTKFKAFAFLSPDKDFKERVTVVVKGTFDISPNQPATISTDQWAIAFEDQYLGEPAKSSMTYESDLTPFKPATDVVLVGSAYSRRGHLARELDVRMEVGTVKKILRVFGDRRWSFGSLNSQPKITRPEPFSRMPITYERAFGGPDPAAARENQPPWEKRNPIGTGFFFRCERETTDGCRLPNIEDPTQLIHSWKDKPSPQGFGFIGKDWAPRIQHVGTYDDHWRETRCPLLPVDFDERFFQAAHPDLLVPGYLRGNELVRLMNLSPDGEYCFSLPDARVIVSTRILFRDIVNKARLDTVSFFPDQGKMVLLWRALFEHFDSPWDVKFIQIMVQQ